MDAIERRRRRKHRPASWWIHPSTVPDRIDGDCWIDDDQRIDIHGRIHDHRRIDYERRIGSPYRLLDNVCLRARVL
jgi:hypothetical protein